MKKQLASVILSSMLCLIAQLAFAQSGVVNSTQNPLQVALLHWDQANQVPTEFAVGNGPISVAFDGGSIWVANAASNTVTKLAANDGTVLGTFPVSGEPLSPNSGIAIVAPISFVSSPIFSDERFRRKREEVIAVRDRSRPLPRPSGKQLD